MRRIGAAIGAVLIVVVAAVWFTHTSLQQDFAAYYVAGNARRLGLDPYLNHVQPGTWTAPALWDGVAPFRHSRFLYPPLVAELFRPLAALPYPSAKAVFTALAVAAWVATAFLFTAGGRAAFLGAGALFFPLYLHLERGQLDLLVLPLLVIAWRTRERPALAGAALALAGLLKPAALGLLPVLAVLRLGRVAVFALLGVASLAAVTIAASGPSLTRRYVAEVLPRALVYGEGGTEAMLLPDARFPKMNRASYRQSLWDGPTSASLPRLLAPHEPSPATALGPFVAALLALTWAARRLRNRSADAAQLVYLAGAVVCVVTSPSGWTMGLVWALPIVPVFGRLRIAAALPPQRWLAPAVAWIACAVPAPAPGFAAVAGAGLVVATLAVASATAPT